MAICLIRTQYPIWSSRPVVTGNDHSYRVVCLKCYSTSTRSLRSARKVGGLRFLDCSGDGPVALRACELTPPFHPGVLHRVAEMCDGEDPRVRAVSAAGPTRTIFPITSVTNNLSSCFFHEMADHSGSTRFQALFESALQAYERKTGVKLAQHPLALDLQSCDTVDNIIILLQGQTQAFSDFRERDRMMKAVKATVSILNPLSEAASLVDAVGLVVRKR